MAVTFLALAQLTSRENIDRDFFSACAG